MNKSIATIEKPQFINLQPLEINPLMSKCEIKVLYIGENRNGSYITEEVAEKMSKTLRGAPIVGYYKPEKEDFADHGQKVIIDDEGIKFECLTKPYGFVSPDAKVWFQTFDDTDHFGNVETRKYLMTTGYLWTGQFEECQIASEEGRPHSMELDDKTLKGSWERNPKTNMDFFIINDAIFSKLCILGADVEPCFEGGSITAPNISSNFTKMDDDFKRTLFSMMQELQFALKGGQQMENENVVVEEENVSVNDVVVENDSTITSDFENESTENVSNEEQVPVAEEETNFAASKKEEEEEKENEPASEENQKEDDSKEEDDEEKKKKYSKKEEEEKEGKKEENSDAQPTDKENEDEEDKKKKYELLETEFSILQEKYSALEEEYNKLVAFKAQVEEAKKDEMISRFAFLSDADKKEVIENKANYTVDEIEAKLSIICVRNKVNFNLDDNLKTDDIMNLNDPVLTYNCGNEDLYVPDWIKAVEKIKEKK